MVRKGSKSATTYANLTAEDVDAIVLATSGSIKDKAVDPRKIVGTIHIKKYLADAKINGKVETWISIIKKLTAPVEDGKTKPELTSDELEALEQCKVETKTYLEDEASDALKAKVLQSSDELKNLKDVSSSMKFKFSRFAHEVVTHVINLMVRELLTFTCDSCAAQKAKLTKVSHVPWSDLQTKLMAGLYMNTKATFESVHPITEPVEESDAAAEEEATEESPVEETKAAKPRLSQYISNTFKEIVCRDERFKGLLLGKEVTSLVNDIIYQVLDRYTNVIKPLLQATQSKTVNERLAVLATKILLQDHVHATDADVLVVLDVVQARLDELKVQPEVEAEVEEPVEDAPKPAKKGAKKH
ncbi:hypothetical protein Poli38472_006844 [Pythium oligandrum]|uniref:Uncharacterized protein n=1 Tax=Pythium oligandrum TaxID=41045 RepID=A0A8K1FDF1_PYTOL|nr:hypothetical protein Poli38472_006844 [Pythium oligandrum]|eukprot:TMW56834.1 hypothetical protein Poli38472_006844 [Pythium oligandrum]